jgi:hypothetical protein
MMYRGNLAAHEDVVITGLVSTFYNIYSHIFCMKSRGRRLFLNGTEPFPGDVTSSTHHKGKIRYGSQFPYKYE